MTIQLLQAWNGYKPGIYSTMGPTEEARLVAAGLARNWYATIDGLASDDTLRMDQVSTVSSILREVQPPAALCVRSGRSAVGWTLTNTGGATATMAVTATNSPFGVPALKITIPNDTGTVDVIAGPLGLSNFTAGTGNLVAHIYIEDELGIKQVRPYLGNDSGYTRNMERTYRVSNDNQQRNNGHHLVHLNAGNAVANTLLTTDAGDYLRLRMNAQPAGAAVWIEGIYVPEPVTPWLVVTVDDSDVSMYTRFHAELQARKLQATFGIDWDAVGTNPALYVTQAQLQAMYEYGHDISSHNRANTAYPDELPPTAQPNDAARLTYCTAFDYTRSLMRGLGWTRGLGYHPFVQGSHDGALVDAMKAHGAVLMRGAGVEMNVEPFRLAKTGVLSQRKLGSAATLAQAKGWVDLGIRHSQDVVCMGHILADTASGLVTWAQSDFGALLDYALSQGVRVGSVSQWANARGFSI